jgi:hypothetical protein
LDRSTPFFESDVKKFRTRPKQLVPSWDSTSIHNFNGACGLATFGGTCATAMTDRVTELLATATAPLVNQLRKMTPLDVDTLVGAIFVVCAVFTQIALVVIARAVGKALAPATPARSTSAPTTSTHQAHVAVTQKPPTAVVEADISGFAWMRAAGITPGELYVHFPMCPSRGAFFHPLL